MINTFFFNYAWYSLSSFLCYNQSKNVSPELFDHYAWIEEVYVGHWPNINKKKWCDDRFTNRILSICAFEQNEIKLERCARGKKKNNGSCLVVCVCLAQRYCD